MESNQSLVEVVRGVCDFFFLFLWLGEIMMDVGCDGLSGCVEVWRQARGREYRPKRSFWTAIAIQPASEYSPEILHRT